MTDHDTKLHTVQIEALERAAGQAGWGHFLEMGLGKTLLTLVEYQRLWNERKAKTLLVLCPNSFKSGWAAEIEKHGFDFPVHIWQRGGAKTALGWIREHRDNGGVMVVNYEAIRAKDWMETRRSGRRTTYLPGDVAKAFVAQMAPVMIVADESISLKGNTSKQRRAAKMLSSASDYRRCLSGKPLTQGPQDLWGQLDFLDVLNGMTFWSWRNRYCKMGGWKMKQVVGTLNEAELSERLAQVSFRARKIDWLDLPEKIYTSRSIELSPAQKAQYAAMEKEMMLDIETGVVTADMAITRMLKLAQITSGFVIHEENPVDLVEPKDNAKLQLVRQLMEEEVEGKAIIVANFRHSIHLLHDMLANEGYAPVVIQGGMPSQTIDHAKDLFNHNPACRVLIGQVQSLRYGHTLLGSEAEPCMTTIYYENSYSLNDRAQSEDRNHRHGQKHPVTYVDISATPLDRRVIHALQKKDSIARAILDTGRAT